jgi:hypothetical protein
MSFSYFMKNSCSSKGQLHNNNVVLFFSEFQWLLDVLSNALTILCITSVPNIPHTRILYIYIQYITVIYIYPMSPLYPHENPTSERTTSDLKPVNISLKTH